MSDNTIKPRGPGAPTGRRPVVWVCSGIVDEQLVTEKFIVRDQSPGKESTGSFPKEVAEKEYQEKHGVNPEVTLGPFFDKRGSQANKAKKKRFHVDRDNLDQCKLGIERRNAIFGNWKGYVNTIEGQPDLAWFWFIGEVNPSDKKRNPPAPGKVRLSDLEFTDSNGAQKIVAAS